ncbi:ribonuclease D [Nocardioides sp.]|uniref:ribonuclease D n=1 Tax=Nocardioides sp. TaxID=35761 RepID=UPI002735BC62|nr:ribonuclease D [Nocardioides sp.]MDP3890811.1 ribonuclease D [Nocardioides sp.]
MVPASSPTPPDPTGLDPTGPAPTGTAPTGTAPQDEPAPTPLLVLRDGLPRVIETEADLRAYCTDLAAGSGPVAIDAERASGYRYSARAYLIQLRREGAGTALVDPIAFDSLAPLQEALAGTEWILHAATQDLPCLAEVGLLPDSLFDTELAGRLLGYPRVGLATLVETLLGQRLRKEHSAADWSTRPLPESWLEYAALDVEVLLEIRQHQLEELVATGKETWARQEFDHLLGHRAPVRDEPWRRTSGTNKVRGRRALGALRAMWETRDRIARERDVTPGRILPDSALIVAAQTMPADRRTLLATRGFHGRGAERYANQWVAALDEARELAEDDLPSRTARSTGPPPARAWSDRDPVAARRLVHARAAMAELSERVSVPVENLLTPDLLRRALWAPPRSRHPEELGPWVAETLAEQGARPWQVELTTDVIVAAVLAGDVEPEPDPAELEQALDASDAGGPPAG